MIGFCPLASGSKGNAIYLGTKKTKILIDAGISLKKLKERLKEIHVELDEIDAVFISHEHSDHISGLKALCMRYDIDIVANAETAKGIYKSLLFKPSFKIFSTNETFHFKGLEVHPFSIQHDTLDPVGFVIYAEGKKIGFCADLGFVTTLVQKNLENCDYLYIEANHEEDMVMASNRPPLYKQRVLGRQGHLSNAASGSLLISIIHKGLKHVHLAHLSSECNHPDKAKEIIQKLLQKQEMSVDISIAYQEKISKAIYF